MISTEIKSQVVYIITCPLSTIYERKDLSSQREKKNTFTLQVIYFRRYMRWDREWSSIDKQLSNKSFQIDTDCVQTTLNFSYILRNYKFDLRQ